MDGDTDSDLYEMINGFPRTIDALSSTITTFASTTNSIAPTIMTTQTILENNHQMSDDWGLYAIVNGFPPTIGASSRCFTTTPTITTFAPYTTTTSLTIPVNNNQMMNDWGIDAIVNRSYPTHNASWPSSIIAATTTTPLTTPANNNQMLNDWSLDAIVNRSYPTNNDYLSSHAIATTITTTTTLTPAINITNPTTFIPTIPNTPVMLLDNHQLLEDTIYWDPHGMANQICSDIVPSSSSSFVATTTFIATTPTTPTNNYQNWEQHTMASSFSPSIFGSSSSFLGATTTTTLTPTNVHYDYPMHINNIKKMMQNPNNPLNFSKNHLSGKNWPVLTLPFLGKLTDKTIPKQQQNRLERRQDISESTNIDAQSSSTSNQRKYEKRIYKMPVEALDNDKWSWRKYGEKSVEGSPYPRVYYKCDSSKECGAKRRVEKNRSDLDLVTLKYTGHHNHPMPMLMNSSVNDSAMIGPTNSASDNVMNHPNSSKPISATTTSNSEMSKDDHIFEGLVNLVDLERKA